MNSVQFRQFFEPKSDRIKPTTFVSKASRFCDDVWVLDDPNPAKPPSRRKINWARRLPNNNMLTDTRYAGILEPFKTLIFLLIRGAGVRGSFKNSSAVNAGASLLAFAEWLIMQGIEHIGDVNDVIADKYRQHCQTSWGIYSRRLRKKDTSTAGRSLAAVTQYSRLAPLRYLVQLRELLPAAPDVSVAWYDKTAPPQKSRGVEIPKIPRDVAYKLYGEAFRWINENAGALIIAHSERMSIARRCQRGEYNKRKREMRAVLRNQIDSISVRGIATPLSGMSGAQFNRALITLETACYIIIAGFAGMRVSEITALEIGCLRSIALPQGDALALKSFLQKTSPSGPIRAQWLAGVDEPDNPVRLAVDVMTRLRRIDRLWMGSKHLFGCYAVKYSHRRRATTLSEPVLNRRLNEFIVDTGLDVDWKLSTHQFRKTFAHMAVNYYSCPILALKRHFKHVSLQMTDHYVGTDGELLDLMIAEHEALITETLDRILQSEALAGKMGERIATNGARFRGQAGKEVRSNYIVDLISNTDLTLLPHEYGACIMFRDTATCGGELDNIGVSTCIGCANFIVGAQHAPYWRSRLKQLQEFRAFLGGLTRAEDRVAAIDGAISQAREVLKKIGS